MTTRYYELTECVHGNDGVCDHVPTDRRAGACMRLDCNVLHGEPCPGGQRRELTVDYEVAAIAAAWHDRYADFDDMPNEWPYQLTKDPDEQDSFRRQVKGIVDAAIIPPESADG